MSKRAVMSPDDIRRLQQYAWTNLGREKLLELKDIKSPTHVGFFREKESYPGILLDVFTNPDYFYFLCKEILNLELLPFQMAILKQLWIRKYPLFVASRGGGKSWLLAVYALLRMILTPKAKVVIAGAGFRQSKIIFEYMETIWAGAPLLRDIAGTGRQFGVKKDPDRWVFRLLNSVAVAIPIGDGSKIRGLRATHIISDEFAMVPEAVYENVISGFAAVKASPGESVRRHAREKMEQELGLKNAIGSHEGFTGNQAILSGTAYYEWNHFAKYWKRYKAIVMSKGNTERLYEIFNGAIPDNFDWRDYCIIRIPVELLPEEYMDMQHVARSRATIHSGIYAMEFQAVFTSDSSGFFRRSLIENCVCKDEPPPKGIDMPSCGPVYFSATTRGMGNRRYVYGVDPASEQDNFSIVVLELWPDHRRIVYTWTTTRAKHRDLINRKATVEADFYKYCVRKLRNLMKIFPCEIIGLDGQGGGVAIEEGLHDTDKLEEGEIAIWPTIDQEKEKPTDYEMGLHILEIVQFASSDWTSQANHGLRKDFEDRVLIFPYFDSISIGLAAEEDKATGCEFDTLEDCVMEIEEMKDELTTIVHSQTGISGRDRWDTPEIKLPGGKKGRQRKDRYSALLIANMVGRTLQRLPTPPPYSATGGFVKTIDVNVGNEQPLYKTGPEWFLKAANDLY